MTLTSVKKLLIQALLSVFIVTTLTACAQKNAEPPADPATKCSVSDAAALGVLGIIAVPMAVIGLPFMALSAIRGEDIGLSELGLKEKYGPPTTIFKCANDYFSLWHYRYPEGPNENVYFFIDHTGYVQDVQFTNKYEGLCIPVKETKSEADATEISSPE